MKIKIISALLLTLSCHAAQDTISKTELLSAVTHIKGIQTIISDYLNAHDQRIWTFRLQEKPKNYLCAFSPNSLYFAFAAKNRVLIWHTQEARILHSFKSSDEPVTAFAFDPSSSQLAQAADKQITFWNLESGSSGNVISRSEAVTSVAYAPQNSYFASGTQSGKIRIYKLDSKKNHAHFNTQHLELHYLQFTPCAEKLIAQGFSDIQIFDLTGQLVQKLKFCAPLTTQLGLFALFKLGSIYVGNDISQISGKDSATVESCQKIASGSAIFACGPRDTIATGVFCEPFMKIWSARTGNLLYALEQEGEVEKLCYSPDDRYLACAADNQSITIWGKQLDFIAPDNVLKKA